ncbi:bifunctional serine/threonine-protein kinase/ABC transporter substrate-binding protein [Streptomyces sp. NPDC028635]|uniref:bifunctional serine/threonine-protein kinase/ABC transporter substrate-binding protein n=1 Tax=Streptomyces sp. NPDC028635 TaxID=3154800 RepID=UPI003406D052
MEPLRTSDPARVAEYRLLRRLGAGGMGVVYLARSGAGTLVALKLVLEEYAEDEGFRERFRREVATARRITSPWAVPVVDADPEAAAPWLATEFVPGPSLAEAVTAHGPLAQPGLRVLGARLAEALHAVHTAGLVHRDVKPGNVLLAVDGPRLIDFGIARAPEETTLTATGMVVGTPGYLSPEQARAGEGPSVGAPSDIFSLGCVLAFAATGRPPFGTGAPDALMFRAVHDPANLDGVPQDVAAVLRGCLEKDPRDRPTAGEVRAAFEGDRPVPAPAEGTGGAPDGTPEAEPPAWLPEPVVRLIAERSASVLELPDIDATEVDAAAVPTAGAPTEAAAEAAAPPGRRRLLLLAGAAAVVAAGGGLAAWAVTRDDGPPATTAGGLPVYVLGVHADLTGDRKDIGRAQERGVRLAVEQFNARTDRPFTLSVRAEDDRGDPAEAARAAQRLADDRSVLAVIGPTTDATAAVSLTTYDTALLPVVAVSPGAISLSVQGHKSFFQARPQDSILGFYLRAFLLGTARARTVGLIDDRKADDYAWELCGPLSKLLREARRPSVPKVVSALQTDFAAVLDELTAAGIDSLVFAGYHDRAALLARELHDRRFTGARAAAQGVLDERFLSAAGAAADGWTIVAPATDPSVQPEGRKFAAAHRGRFGTAPHWYAAEAYDAAGLVTSALRSLPAAQRSRARLTEAIRAVTYRGITKNFAFDPATGALRIDGSGVFLWKVSGGVFQYAGPAPYQVPV